MGVSYYMEVVDRLDARGLRWSENRRTNRFRCDSDDLRMLAGALERLPGPTPAMTWYQRAGHPDGDDGLDIKACFSPAAVRRELDEIRVILTAHLSTLPVYTFFGWTGADGMPAAANSLDGFIDGRQSFLVGGWEPPRLDTMIDGERVRAAVTAAAVFLNWGTPDGPEREITVERSNFLTYYAPLLDAMRDVCDKALARGGLICCLIVG